MGWEQMVQGGIPTSLPTSLVARDQRVRLLRSSNKLSSNPKNSPMEAQDYTERDSFEKLGFGLVLFFILVREVVGV